MITKDNLPAILTALGFHKRGTTYSKSFGVAPLEVNLSKEEIIYPEAQGMVINERQTCNFSANENFVVFECVHRLLEKGYKPEHIELEPKWKLGHGASGGRADILIKDNAGKPLLIIECKTPGREFNKAWRSTLQDGDQLFSYAQQISETQFLCLYASDFAGDTLTYQSHIIAHRDNEKYLADNPQFKSFKNVTDVKERFAVWRDTYKLDYTTKGIFEGNIQPYHIGKDKYSLADLHGISADDQQKKYHEFATILRQHNVSGRENAFDKLVNLFLCKLVDETENPDELKFYWKGVAYDTHFDLLDRLQQLYQSGMGKFLGEDITYIDQSAVLNAMRFIKQNPDATQKAVWHLFQQQKFFTNNDFSLIDVHNEKLFYQNAEVLLKILQMWQDIQLTGGTHHQFLGDMFEGFLDQGIKQSEGQYFTPMPICRFILMSLPLASLVQGNTQPPKAIDYACGAGHFLNELALQIKPLVESHKQRNLADYHKAIYGMEKEYRLSKVAKVSAFMYGQQEINICYGDALINGHPAFSEIKDNSFDLLVANPPYSVRGFLETLPEEERDKYELTATIDKLDTNNSIETFFIERAKQLLKAGGVAGLILPSSILSNGNSTYITTRSILLRYFDIVAIAEFGSGTFGKTGTNTVTLFLRRKATAPDTADHYRERVEEWFNRDDNQPLYEDAHLIDQYAAHIGATAADYRTLLAGEPNAALLAHDTFAQYRAAFDKSTEIVNLKKQRGFKAKPQAEQEAELAKRFLAMVHTIEQDKLYHFVLASRQPNPVLILKSPTDTKAQKQFLGYEWSSAKGAEGIKIIKDSLGHHLTPLYDETDRDNPAKLNRLIADNFDGTLTAIPTELSDYATMARLVDMLDFSRVTFEKQIGLTVKTAAVVQSKWPLVKLGDICNFEYGKPLPEDQRIAGEYPVMGSNGRVGFHSEFLVTGPAIIVGRKGSAGEVYWEPLNCFPIDTTFYIHLKQSKVILLYLFQALKGLGLEKLRCGSGVPGLNRNLAYSLPIPLPSLDIQQQIVSECEAVDAKVAAAQASVNAAQKEITNKMSSVFVGGLTEMRIGDFCNVTSGGTPSRSNSTYWLDGTIPWLKSEVCKEGNVVGSHEFITELGLQNSNAKFFNKNTTLIALVGATKGKSAFLTFPATTNQNIANIASKSDDILDRYLFYVVRQGYNLFIKDLSGYDMLNLSKIKNTKLPVPTLAEQQRLVTEVEALEKDIATAQATIAAAPARKQAIMQRYL